MESSTARTDMAEWQPPSDWLRIRTVDSHTAGEPFRVVVDGFPKLQGATILERRRYAMQHHDDLRKALMWEPRGHADMYGCLVTPPVSPDADLGVLFMHNAGFSTMCGHGVIALATVALETGMLPKTASETTIRLDTPAGLVTARATIETGRVRKVVFRNVPSFVLALDQKLEVAGVGTVLFDLAFGGAFYAFVDAASVGLSCDPGALPDLVEKGGAIKQAIAASRTIDHPFEKELSFLYGVIFLGPGRGPGSHSRNVCIFADGEVDRSPTGTGVSARLAIHHARGELALEEPMVIESIIGTRFIGRVVETTRLGSHPAVVPAVEGCSHITGRHEFLLDPADELQKGFLLR